MLPLFIDIETIPDQSPNAREGIEVSHPAQMKKQETIDAWHNGEGKYAGDKLRAIDEVYLKTGLSGTKGEIICISFSLGADAPQCVGRKLGESEADLLHDFFAAVLKRKTELDDAGCSTGGLSRVSNSLLWVGHYITGFDLRFLWQRCVINKVKPPVYIPVNAKPWDDSVFDTHAEWAGFNGKDGKLGDICQAMGYEGKGDLDGSKVWPYIQAGRYGEVYEYCDDDVYKTRLIYNRMTFSGE